MAKTALMAAYVEPNIKAALVTIASFFPDDNLSDHLREASRRYIESELASLELRIYAAQAVGQTDSEAQRRLAELRAAYQLPDPGPT
jgi:hypothetical protein